MGKLSKDTDLKQPCHFQAADDSHHSCSPSSSGISRLSDSRKCSETPCQPQAPAHWENLSKIWLTKRALRELDRRNEQSEPKQEFKPSVKRKEYWKLQFAPSFLRDFAPTCSRDIERFSRLGGPDLSDLRFVSFMLIYDSLLTGFTKFPQPGYTFDEPMSPSQSTLRKRKRSSPISSSPPGTSESKVLKEAASRRKITAYDRNFEQNLIDHGIYPDGFNPDGQRLALPNNWDEINKCLTQRRPSLSPSRFSDEDFWDFRQANKDAWIESQVTESVLPTIESTCGDSKCAAGGYIFGNLAHLTDGTIAKAKPDRFYGARPFQLDRQIRQELNHLVIPSTQCDRPIAPNFFLEAKSRDGSTSVAERQVCYDGALGARAIHALQSYQQEKPAYNNNAYTITATYCNGTLILYSTHLVEPSGPGCRPKYILTQLKGFMMTSDAESFRQGASAYRNARDWTKKKRDESIRAANKRHLQAQFLLDAAQRLDNFDASTVFGNAESPDKQLGFKFQTEDVEGEPPRRVWKRPKVHRCSMQ